MRNITIDKSMNTEGIIQIDADSIPQIQQSYG